MKIGIYTITNIINNKIYIGYSNNINKRWKEHRNSLLRGSHENRHLQNAYSKYGLENLIFSILIECEEQFLMSEEHYWATLLNVHNRNFGYNIKPTHPHIKNGSTSLETIEKQRISSKRNFDKKLLFVEKFHKGREAFREQLNKLISIPILQYSLAGEFIRDWESTSSAAKFFKCTSPSIGAALKGKRPTAQGFIWRYKYNDNREIIPYFNKSATSISKYDLKDNFIKRYNSIIEAIKDNGLTNGHSTSIRNCCKGKIKSSHGFIWKQDSLKYRKSRKKKL